VIIAKQLGELEVRIETYHITAVQLGDYCPEMRDEVQAVGKLAQRYFNKPSIETATEYF